MAGRNAPPLFFLSFLLNDRGCRFLAVLDLGPVLLESEFWIVVTIVASLTHTINALKHGIVIFFRPADTISRLDLPGAERLIILGVIGIGDVKTGRSVAILAPDVFQMRSPLFIDVTGFVVEPNDVANDAFAVKLPQ